jgi:subtilase family protein
MFSASLLSLMVHSLPLDVRMGSPAEEDTLTPTIFTIPTSSSLAEQLEQAMRRWPGEWPMLPAVGQLSPKLVDRAKDMTKQLSIDEGQGFVWGRIPLNDLIRYYVANSEDPWSSEYVDLGTPIWAASAAGGSTTSIANLLAHTPSPSMASVGAALVDLGITPTASAASVPRDFGGKLRHVSYPPGTSIDLSAHAEEVLEVLLDRLSAPQNDNRKNMLTKTTVSIALINNPAPDKVRLSKDCFDQHCAPEMLDAIKAINSLLDGDKLSDGTLMPAVVNMSVGTHVGPHNGQSPLEGYISGSVFKRERRFPFAAAGNEGLQALSARLELKQGEADYMHFVATGNCTELLIEFWWDEAAGPADMEIIVETEARGMSKSVIPIASGSTGPKLVASAVGQRRSATFLTLCQSPSHGTMSCIAFAVTRPAVLPGHGPLPELRISFDITAKSSNAAIHAWTVICDKQRESHFTRGGPEGTVCAPASDPTVVSVAAFDPARGQMWRDSSRGPASRYDSNAPIESPMMAHLSNNPNGQGGTSFASPRAAADATVPLANSVTRANCTEPKKLIEQTYGAIATDFDPRYGFSKQTV